MADEVRQCKICGNDAEPGRWMLCLGCEAKIHQTNRDLYNTQF